MLRRGGWCLGMCIFVVMLGICAYLSYRMARISFLRSRSHLWIDIPAPTDYNYDEFTKEFESVLKSSRPMVSHLASPSPSPPSAPSPSPRSSPPQPSKDEYEDQEVKQIDTSPAKKKLASMIPLSGILLNGKIVPDGSQ